MSLEFREPKQIGRLSYDKIMEELQARPGEWAVVDSGATHNALSSPASTLADRGCEVKRRTVAPGVVELFARWPA